MSEKGNNMKKSRRKWTYSGYKRCHECDAWHYDTLTSERPYTFVLCRPCYEWIYVQDCKPLTLFDDLEGEVK